jgi:hypothetical protein
MSELADASALLWRLQLRNIQVGDRWQRLADRWEVQALTSARLFYVAHAMMAFVAADRATAAERILSTTANRHERCLGIIFGRSARSEALQGTTHLR